MEQRQKYAHGLFLQLLSLSEFQTFQILGELALLLEGQVHLEVLENDISLPKQLGVASLSIVHAKQYIQTAS